MTQRRPEIIDWNPTRAVDGVNSRRERWSPMAVGLLGTLLLHTVILQGVILGSRAASPRPQQSIGGVADHNPTGATPANALLLTALSPLPKDDPSSISGVASLAPPTATPDIKPLSPDRPRSVAIPEDSPTVTADTVAVIDRGDAAGQAAMFARYTGQIDARIERVWRRPRSALNRVESQSVRSRTPSGPEGFDCQVRIEQDTEGRVQEVDLLRCNGTIAWQQSLVTAILSASPLPAPPSRRVFTSSLIMRFTALPYTPDRSPDDYELPSVAAASDD